MGSEYEKAGAPAGGEARAEIEDPGEGAHVAPIRAERDSLCVFPSEEPACGTAGILTSITTPPSITRHLGTHKHDVRDADDFDGSVGVDDLTDSPPPGIVS